MSKKDIANPHLIGKGAVVPEAAGIDGDGVVEKVGAQVLIGRRCQR